MTPLLTPAYLFQYLRLVREMDGYGSIVFPNCVCDSRKDGHVIPIVAFSGFKLQACTEDGTKEVPGSGPDPIKKFSSVNLRYARIKASLEAV